MVHEQHCSECQVHAQGFLLTIGLQLLRQPRPGPKPSPLLMHYLMVTAEMYVSDGFNAAEREANRPHAGPLGSFPPGQLEVALGKVIPRIGR